MAYLCREQKNRTISFAAQFECSDSLALENWSPEEEEEEEEPLLIYTAQGSPFRYKKLSVINGSPERNNVLKLCIHMHYTNTRLCNYVQIKDLGANEYEKYHQDSSLKRVQP